MLKVLFVGRFSEEKNILNLIDACKLAVSSASPFYLTLVGHGAMRPAILKKVQDDAMSEYINVIGYLPHNEALFEQYDSHDLLCLPSITEGVPRVIAEALARNLPVVATKAGSIPTLFDGQVKYIDGFDAQSINTAIQWCLKNRDKHVMMTSSGRDVIEKFMLETNANKVDNIIREYADDVAI